MTSKRVEFDVVAPLGVVLALCAVPLALAQAPYEKPPVLRAADRAPPQLDAGPDYRVEDEVVNDGLMNHYRIVSPFGNFEAHSDAERDKRVGEIGAIAKLKNLEGSDEFGKGIANALRDVVEGAKALVTDPVRTIGGIFQGAGTLLRRAGDSVLGDPQSRYEDNALQAVSGVSQSKREFAAQLGIDPYSSNEVLQEALTRVARAAASGNILSSAALAAVSGGAGTFLAVTSGSQTLNEVLKTTPPTDLRRMNREKLQKMEIGADQIDLFLANTNYSPTYQLLLVEALDGMPEVSGKEALVKFAIGADSDALCMLRQRQARMYAAYHAKVQPLERLAASGNLAMARARDGKIVIAVPVDHLVWTESVAQSVANADDLPKEFAGAAAREFWLGGTISPRARAELEARGWKIRENAAEQLIGAG